MTIVKVIDFPTTKVRSCITETEDGDVIIFVNAKHSYFQQRRGYSHEKKHEEDDDLHKGDAQAIEADKH